MLILIIFILFISILLNNIIINKETFNNDNKYVCMYAYYEKNDIYKNNLRIFLEKGYRYDIDYYIIINGTCTVEIPKKDNIVIINKENIGFDFGAWSHCIHKYLTKKYDYYIFLNTSVRGPYINNWLEEFLKLFNKDVKLVGTSINIMPTNIYNYYDYDPPYTHVQSMFFILNREGFEYLNSLDFFNEEEINKLNFMELILKKEINLSQLILKNNWNINCSLNKYKNFDYRIIKNNFNTTSYDGDPYYHGAYFGETIKPEEAIFFKINRNLINI